MLNHETADQKRYFQMAMQMHSDLAKINVKLLKHRQSSTEKDLDKRFVLSFFIFIFIYVSLFHYFFICLFFFIFLLFDFFVHYCHQLLILI